MIKFRIFGVKAHESMSSDADKAEFIQSVQAYYIPASLFVATLISAAGMFLAYNGYALGLGLIAISLSIIVSAFVIFIRFQNKLRLIGKIAREDQVSSDDPS